MNIHLGALYLLAAPAAAVNWQATNFMSSGRRAAAVNMQASNFMSSGRRLDDGDHHDDDCRDETELIFSDEADPDVYQYWDYLIDENTGGFSGNLEVLSDFTARCKAMNGRVAQVSVDYEGEECEGDLSSVPICVGKSCSDDGAEAAWVFSMLDDEDVDCDIVSIKIEDHDYPDDDGNNDDYDNNFDDYSNDDDGDNDDIDFDFILAPYENLSPMCQLNSFDFFFIESQFPIPETTINENGVVQFDFSANKNEFDAYVDQCDMLGGQPIAIQMKSDGTSEESADILNYPNCFGAACDEEDRRMFATQLAKPPFFNGILTTEVESLSGENVPPVDECRDEILRTHLPPSVLYENQESNIVDGEYIGDEEALSDFTALCELMGGRVAPISIKFGDSEGGVCDESDFSSVPTCVGKSCDNEGAEAAWGVMIQSPSFFGDCEAVSIKIEIPSTSKSTKKSKGTKAPKSAKGDKATKAPKSAKGDKATKAPKSAKGDKATKAPKSP